MSVDIQAREDEVASFLKLRFHALVTKDRGDAASLRDEGYVAALPNGLRLTAAQELEMISSPWVRFSAAGIDRIALAAGGEEATAYYSLDVEYPGEGPVRQQGELRLARTGGGWRAPKRLDICGSGRASARPRRWRADDDGKR